MRKAYTRSFIIQVTEIVVDYELESHPGLSRAPARVKKEKMILVSHMGLSQKGWIDLVTHIYPMTFFSNIPIFRYELTKDK